MIDDDSDVLDVASELRITVGSLVRRLRQHRGPDDPSVPETTVLARLDRDGSCSAADLARHGHVSPQSMGVTIAGLQERGLIARTPDPTDGRRILLSLTAAGGEALTDRRNHSTRSIAEAMSATLTAAEIAAVSDALPLLDRLRGAL
ncbi:MarR family winged helix-turn-helix transcriptional regulator [Gordonia sp. SL306]|uniref:MarR family winged helix-turn-helix transcriptional regulator n=1 Tax=Gordonia sp. SL306 TaxID=2995145 RepID=UPI00226FECC0|nr:MarR family transcriptional regulator [Gordonia sp. SL306]WAC56217.1 MarR family transcriptional regulator [Gordonia sp. SL306]